MIYFFLFYNCFGYNRYCENVALYTACKIVHKAAARAAIARNYSNKKND